MWTEYCNEKQRSVKIHKFDATLNAVKSCREASEGSEGSEGYTLYRGSCPLPRVIL